MEAKKSFRDALCMPKAVKPKVVEEPKIVVEEPKIVVEEPKVVDKIVNKKVNKKRNFNKGEFSYESIQIGKYYVVKNRDDNYWDKDVDFLMKCTNKKDGVIYYSIKLDPRCMWPGVGYSPVYSSTKFSDGKITPLPVDYWTNKSKYNINQYFWEDDDDF